MRKWFTRPHLQKITREKWTRGVAHVVDLLYEHITLSWNPPIKKKKEKEREISDLCFSLPCKTQKNGGHLHAKRVRSPGPESFCILILDLWGLQSCEKWMTNTYYWRQLVPGILLHHLKLTKTATTDRTDGGKTIWEIIR
jgi:hypothetical protein